MDRVELILRMAQNKADEGKEKTAEINAIGANYLTEIRDLLAMAREAVEVLEHQEQRFAHFDPNRRVPHTQPPAIAQLQRKNGEPNANREADRGRAASQ